MKAIFFQLFVVFGCLLIGHAVFPYEAPCACSQEKEVHDAEKTVNLANYTLEDHQVARFESGEVYDFSHDLNLTPEDNPVLLDGTFNDVPIKGNDFYEIEPCLNCGYDFHQINDDFDDVRCHVTDRMEALNTYRHQPSLYDDDEWRLSTDRHPKLEMAP